MAADSAPKTRLLCLDLDGTLYGSSHRVSEPNKKAVAAASAAGFEVALCSGRGPTMYVPTARELGVPGGLYMVGYNGAVVYRLGEDGEILDTLFETQMDAAQVDKFLKLALAEGFAIEMDIQNVQYAMVPKSEKEVEAAQLLRNHAELCQSKPVLVEDFEGKVPNKITVCTADPKAFVDACNAVPGFADDGIGIVKGGPYWCETVNLAHDKKKSLELVLGATGLSFKDCIYFGDGSNDASSLKACGLGIAMKQAGPDALAAADKQSEWTNDEDAVAKELQQILEIAEPFSA